MCEDIMFSRKSGVFNKNLNILYSEEYITLAI